MKQPPLINRKRHPNLYLELKHLLTKLRAAVFSRARLLRIVCFLQTRTSNLRQRTKMSQNLTRNKVVYSTRLVGAKEGCLVLQLLVIQAVYLVQNKISQHRNLLNRRLQFRISLSLLLKKTLRERVILWIITLMVWNCLILRVCKIRNQIKYRSHYR